jgi:hypothetical protein
MQFRRVYKTHWSIEVSAISQKRTKWHLNNYTHSSFWYLRLSLVIGNALLNKSSNFGVEWCIMSLNKKRKYYMQ